MSNVTLFTIIVLSFKLLLPIFRAQMWVNASYFVSALLNARCSSSFLKTFHVSFNLYSTWTVDVYQCGVRIFKFRVRGIPQVLDSLRNGSALMTCTALAHAARACSCMVCFVGGTHSARASQVCMRYEALIRGPFASAEKTADPNLRSTSTTVRRTLAYIVGLVSSDGPCRFLKSTIYRYLWLKISVIPIFYVR